MRRNVLNESLILREYIVITLRMKGMPLLFSNRSIVQSMAVQSSGERYLPRSSHWHELCGYIDMVASRMGGTAYGA